MRTQVSLLIVLSVGLACNTDPVGEVKELNVMSMERPWHEHTVESYSKSVDYRFIVPPGSKFGNAKEMCVALEVEANSTLKQNYDAYLADKTNKQRQDAFLDELSQAKVMCISHYLDNRHQRKGRRNYSKIRRHMFSYFDGTTSHRAFCWTNKKRNRYECRNSDRKIIYKIDNLQLFGKGVRSAIAAIGHKYDRNKKNARCAQCLPHAPAEGFSSWAIV